MRTEYKRTDVGVIPDQWDVALLDSVAKRGSGHTPDKAHPEYWGGPVKWVSLQDSDRLDRGYINDTAAKITAAGIANSSARLHPAGTVVLSRDAGVGKSAIMQEAMAVSQHFMAWTCGPSLNNEFLYYWLQANKAEFERIAMGNTIKTIGLPYFRRLCIPLPEVGEQQAIAETLSDADALIESLEQLLAKKRHLKQGAMQELLTGRKRLPGFSGQWERRPLGDLCVKIQDGTHFSPEMGGNDFLYVTSKNIRPGKLDVLSADRISAAEHAKIYARCDVVKGDLLLTKDGANTGNAALNTLSEPFSLLSSVAMLRFDSRRDTAQYFLYQILAYEGQRQIAEMMSGNAITRLTLMKIRLLRFPVPCLAEQSAIAEILGDMDRGIDALEAKLTKARQIKQGMMQELLTGRIRLV